MRFRKKKIKVKVDAEKGNKAAGYVEKEITAHCRSGLAYHKALGKKSGFSVTHLASGLTIDPGNGSMVLHSEEVAKEYVKFAESLGVNWESDLEWKEWWNKVETPPPPLDTIRHQWATWWDEACKKKREEADAKEKEEASVPILELFGVDPD